MATATARKEDKSIDVVTSIHDLKEGAKVDGCFLLVDRSSRTAPRAGHYLVCHLADKTGTITALEFDRVSYGNLPSRNTVVHVVGRVIRNGRDLRIKIAEMTAQPQLRPLDYTPEGISLGRTVRNLLDEMTPALDASAVGFLSSFLGPRRGLQEYSISEQTYRRAHTLIMLIDALAAARGAHARNLDLAMVHIAAVLISLVPQTPLRVSGDARPTMTPALATYTALVAARHTLPATGARFASLETALLAADRISARPGFTRDQAAESAHVALAAFDSSARLFAQAWLALEQGDEA